MSWPPTDPDPFAAAISPEITPELPLAGCPCEASSCASGAASAASSSEVPFNDLYDNTDVELFDAFLIEIRDQFVNTLHKYHDLLMECFTGPATLLPADLPSSSRGDVSVHMPYAGALVQQMDLLPMPKIDLDLTDTNLLDKLEESCKEVQALLCQLETIVRFAEEDLCSGCVVDASACVATLNENALDEPSMSDHDPECVLDDDCGSDPLCVRYLSSSPPSALAGLDDSEMANILAMASALDFKQDIFDMIIHQSVNAFDVLLNCLIEAHTIPCRILAACVSFDETMDVKTKNEFAKFLIIHEKLRIKRCWVALLARIRSSAALAPQDKRTSIVQLASS
eukprot:TRINITY_DN20287_c0_g3_i1.p1 TRINITY_DN20287_c0_g3~~TRINITY_DN20287_c0_g3_i1.p1  ORF type:complete len:340 (-),score=59.04 TRINITY_DN20287_c0_g3_i1:313-1332(-)